jgi:hypothetical protein
MRIKLKLYQHSDSYLYGVNIDIEKIKFNLILKSTQYVIIDEWADLGKFKARI